VQNHALHPRKVGGGVTPSIGMICAIRDRPSDAVQIINYLQFTMSASIAPY